MGNNCVNARASIHHLSGTLWGARSHDRFGFANKEENKEPSTEMPSSVKSSKEPEGPISVQHTPPDLVSIVKDGNVATKPINSQEVIMMIKEEEKPPARDTKWEDVVKEHREDGGLRAVAKPKPVARTAAATVRPNSMEEMKLSSAHVTVPRPDGQKPKVEIMEKPKPAEAERPEVARDAKRMASAGLQAESILRTETGHLREHYKLGRKLGNGQFGTTFLCVERATGKPYACKSIAKRKLLTLEDVEDVRREIEIMHHLSGNPNIISIKGAYEDNVAVHVVMELCTGGELFDRIVNRGHYSERKAAQLTRIIVSVIQTCHSLGVMHRDLKPENFLFVNEEEDSPIKTIDFGLSIFFKPGVVLYVVLLIHFVFVG